MIIEDDYVVHLIITKQENEISNSYFKINGISLNF